MMFALLLLAKTQLVLPVAAQPAGVTVETSNKDAAKWTSSDADVGVKQGSGDIAMSDLKDFAGFEQPWHDDNDAMIAKVVTDFNTDKGWKPGDADYLDANLVKAWALQESGGHAEIFTAGDMMQMNNRGDWAPEKEWFGVRHGEKLSPEKSLRTALDWAFYKAEETRRADGGISEGWHATMRGEKPFSGYESRFTDWERALTRYNGGGVADYYGDIERRLSRTV